MLLISKAVRNIKGGLCIWPENKFIAYSNHIVCQNDSMSLFHYKTSDVMFFFFILVLCVAAEPDGEEAYMHELPVHEG